MAPLCDRDGWIVGCDVVYLRKFVVVRLGIATEESLKLRQIHDRGRSCRGQRSIGLKGGGYSGIKYERERKIIDI